ncbi:MAG TPA: septum formation initiator family protein [Thermosynergistes sp.]|jgi:cell division protein FtsB|nr:MAG: Septum formation initiator [Synergistales bacterium 54_24]MBC7077012.1 septum formation initiator family protein [Synergistales bacterium]HAF51036.1 septum formation initiator [Synergistaceae bacterium]HOA76307.1 septum formation initiator family protein [Thermosynergistes sp.]HOM24714.1 septum formation initiator family protein [Thermosynergistes sp.]
MLRLRWILCLTIIGLMAAILTTSYVMELSRLRHLSSAIDQRVAELVRLKRRIQDKEEKILYYKTEEGIAREAREQFNLVMPGERIYRIEVASPDLTR